ncbi:hypothetical protein [Xanthomonas melonis]|uniref:hypothetical protein n=1 Tax=Xanthomonas melonis TaxID=56456 RepID=UPI003EB70868
MRFVTGSVEQESQRWLVGGALEFGSIRKIHRMRYKWGAQQKTPPRRPMRASLACTGVVDENILDR